MMNTDEYNVLRESERGNWLRLRTLVILRWFAIAGQTVAIFVATRFYELQIDVGPASMTIGALVIANLISSFVYPENTRLTEREATAMIGFDIMQLSLLLYFTGGLNNPFALLVLAPVTISATVLHLGSTIALGGLAIALITIISQVSHPMETANGKLLLLPPLFQFGFWVSLVIGVVFLAIYARKVTTEMHAMSEALLATQMALGREQKLTDLGGVVAAAAHELGTPLATIKLVSTELMGELKDRPELLEDVALIRSQADRCRDILQSMGRAGKDDLHLKGAPLEAVVRESADPHIDRGRTVVFDVHALQGATGPQPNIPRSPEIVHGLRNLVQNAVDFSDSQVEIDVQWSDDRIVVRISDDGHGFPQSVIGRIGDPFMRRRRSILDRQRRPDYDGMGLGLFIAKTLLERSGATLSFANETIDGTLGWTGKATGGAVVTVNWPRKMLAGQVKAQDLPLGENQLISS